MAVDYRLQERLRHAQDENARLTQASNDTPLESGGGGGDSGGMDGIAERVGRLELRQERVEVRLDAIEDRMGRLETRMDRLEIRMDGIDTRLRGVEQAVAAVNAKLDVLTTQIVAKLPSWWQMPAVIGSTIAVIGALWAAFRILAKSGYF